MKQDDPLNRPYVCLNCKARLVAGELISRGTDPSGWLHCPKCNSLDVQHVDPEPRCVPEYFGDIGTTTH